MLTLMDILLLIGIALIGATAQLCLKQGADSRRSSNFIRSIFQPWILTGAALMAANILALIWILRRLPLTLVMPVTALVYILVPIGAFLFFKERMLPRFWFGAVFIVTGIVIIAV